MALRKPKLTVKEPKAPKPALMLSRKCFIIGVRWLSLYFVCGFACELTQGPIHFAAMFVAFSGGMIAGACFIIAAYLFSYESRPMETP